MPRSGSPIQLHMPYPTERPVMSPAPSSPYGSRVLRAQPPSPPAIVRTRYSPYQSHVNPTSTPANPPTSHHSSNAPFDNGENIRLAPIRELYGTRVQRRVSTVSLPPISSFNQGTCDDSATVLQRLRTSDDFVPRSLPALGSKDIDRSTVTPVRHHS